MYKVLSNKKAIILFMLPAVFLFMCLVLFPILASVGYTFYDGVPGINFTFSGLENYKALFHDKLFLKYFITNLKYVAVTVAGQITFGLFLAFLLTFLVKKHVNFVRIALFIPVVLPSVATGQLFVKIFEIAPQYGLLNSLLEFLGLHNWIHAWLGDISTALWVVCATDIWKACGMYALIFYSAMVDIPGDMLEAAAIDGAGKPQLIRKIYLPLLKPILCTGLILSLTGTFKVYEAILTLTKGGPGTSTYVLSMYMYDTAFSYQQYGYGSVIAIVILVECLLSSWLVRRIFVKDNTEG